MGMTHRESHHPLVGLANVIIVGHQVDVDACLGKLCKAGLKGCLEARTLRCHQDRLMDLDLRVCSKRRYEGHDHFMQHGGASACRNLLRM